ncbi:hypothetical protein DFH09DRAFT_804372, partial [Mycena vulgaris]
RNESGLYDSVAKQIQDMGPEALANLDYPDNITHAVEDWSGNHRYLDASGNELRVAIVGEVLGPASGTLLRAQGNHYARDGDRPVDDTTKVKDVLALGIPTCATTRLYNTVLNQIICASQITDANTDEDKRKGSSPTIKNWTKASVEGRQQHDIMMVTMQPKYGAPSAAGAPKPKRAAKRGLDEVDGIDTAPVKSASPEVAVEPGHVKIGAFYEPSLLPDFGGDYFDLVKSKLVQHDIRDTEANLIPPWKMYEALRPGTLVLVLVTLRCFSMSDDGGKDRRQRKIYQMNAESIRILAELDEFVEPRTRPMPPI